MIDEYLIIRLYSSNTRLMTTIMINTLITVLVVVVLRLVGFVVAAIIVDDGM